MNGIQTASKTTLGGFLSMFVFALSLSAIYEQIKN